MRKHYVRYIRSSPPSVSERANVVERQLPLGPGELVVTAWPVGEEWIAEVIVWSTNINTDDDLED